MKLPCHEKQLVKHTLVFVAKQIKIRAEHHRWGMLHLSLKLPEEQVRVGEGAAAVALLQVK